MARAYIPVYFDLLEEAQELTDQEFGRLIRAAIMYARGNENYMGCIQGNERFVLRFLIGQIDRNNAISEVRAKAGASKREQNGTNENKMEQNGTKANKKFVPPTVEEVRAYCRERKSNVDAEQFVSFYGSKGWKVGNQPMKDWRLAISTWERRDKSGKTVSAQQYTQRDYSEIDDFMMDEFYRRGK